MARPCSICSHEKKERIENALRQKDVNINKLARIFNTHRTALMNHREHHMDVVLPGITYGDFDALNARVGELIHTYTQETKEYKEQIRYWKSQVGGSSSELEIALGVLHFTSLPQGSKELQDRRRALSQIFHPDRNPEYADFMQRVNWAADIVGQRLNGA